MASGAGVSVLLLVAMMVVVAQARQQAWRVSCSNPRSRCFRVLQTCPPKCPNRCKVDCFTCRVKCDCDRRGAVCQDPRFIGGDGVMFYFHGQKDRDFCVVSDPSLHINAHFIGKRGSGKTRDFTWVQSIGILFGSHQLYVGAKTTRVWDENVDVLALAYDGEELDLAQSEGETWELPSSGLEVIRMEAKNAISIEVAKSFKLEATVVPIGAEESRVHGYNITSEDCFAHLELHFQFYNLSTDVTGVLGQTYAPGYTNPVKRGVPMPIMGGESGYRSSSILEPDCAVSTFGKIADEHAPIHIIRDAMPVTCGNSGQGFVCRR